MKKTLFVALTLSALFAFAGCSSQSDTSSAPPTSAETGQAGAENTADISVLTAAMQLGDVEKAITMNIPSQLEPYLSLEPVSPEDSSTLLIHFTNGDAEANIGSLTLSTIEDYEAIKDEGLPVGDPLLQDEENGVILTHMGMQDSVFEPETENYDLVMQYDDALGDILSSITME